MTRFLRMSQCVTSLALVALAALAAIPLAARAQGGATLNDASSVGLANHFWVVVGNDSTPFQKVEITWAAPTSRMVAPRQTASARSADADRSGPASIRFIRAVSDETQKTREWVQRGTLAPVRVTLVGSDGSRSVMTAPSFKVDKWSINSMDAGASQVSVETLQVSTPVLHVQGAGFGG